ncbi:MAG: hypothetical protein AAGA56_17050 [Myxococcota bacterium]
MSPRCLGLFFLLSAPLTACDTPPVAANGKGGEGDAVGAATSSSAAKPARASSPTFDAKDGVTWQDGDGEWQVGVVFVAENTGDVPIEITRAGIVVDEFELQAESSTLSANVRLEMGEKASGSLVYAPASMFNSAKLAPNTVTLSFGVWRRSIPLRTVPIPPADEPVPETISGSLEAKVTGPASTFRQDDGDHTVVVPLEVNNGANYAVRLADDYVGASVGGTSGMHWPAAGAFPDMLVLKPGEVWRGNVAWYFDDKLPQPTKIDVRVGPVAHPAATAEGSVVPRGAAAP